MFDLAKIQAKLTQFGLDGWLLYSFRGSNVLAERVLDVAEPGSRRFYYFIPIEGEPQKLVHRIEAGALDHLPGEKQIYLRWQELEEGIAKLLGTSKKIAMEYSERCANPYISRVDAGTVELVKSLDVQVVSSGDLIQSFEAVWTEEQWQLHLQADGVTQAAFEKAWKFIADRTRDGGSVGEIEVQDLIMQHFAENNLTTYHAPIVGVGPNSGDPHYDPKPGNDAEIHKGDLVLVDLWAKVDHPNGVYSDLTKMGFVGEETPAKYDEIFAIVTGARDAGIARVKEAFASNRVLQGWEVDDATRQVIDSAGYGEYFVHRTGHNIGRETHGNGANIDNLETHEERSIMRETCFSIEPGIYMEEFGMRSEVDVYVDAAGEVHVTGGLQTEVLPILAKY